MRVHPAQLVSGCIITNDVYGKTNQPVVPKKTVVDDIHIEFLQKFLIDEVTVAEKLNNGEPFLPEKIIEEEVKEEVKTSEIPFINQYLECVQQYKKMFKSWQGGTPVKVDAVRNVIVPLIEKILDDYHEIFTLHHYSSKKEYFYHHSIAVGLISSFIAKKLNYPKGDIIQIGITGFLSDCGMAKIDSKILQKEGSLTEAELKEVKSHPTYSYRMIEKIPALKSAVKIGVLQHHERLDGSGYPMGVKESKLHEYGKIVAVSDMYHAMISERIYRSKQSPFKVIEEITKEQFGKFDLRIVQVFVQSLTNNFTTGTKVRLSNNNQGEIIFIESKLPTRPMIRLENEQIIHLKDYPNLYIEEVLS